MHQNQQLTYLVMMMKPAKTYDEDYEIIDVDPAGEYEEQDGEHK